MNTAEKRRALYADTKQHETRLRVQAAEFRDNGDGTANVTGYASITNVPYEVNDWLGSYDETVSRGAFGKALREADDVRLLVNHDGIPLARTSSGTLNLREVTDPLADPQGRGQTGLWCDATLATDSPLAQSVVSAMSRGDMSEMSFAFQATRQEWNADYTQRTVNEVRLFDVSVVTYPANPATSISLNSAKVIDIARRAAAGNPIADADELALIGRLSGLLDSIDERHADPEIEVPAERAEQLAEETHEPEIDLEVRERALALARARAHK